MNNASDFIRNANCCFVLSKAKAVTIAEDVTLPASAGYFVYTKFFSAMFTTLHKSKVLWYGSIY